MKLQIPKNFLKLCCELVYSEMLSLSMHIDGEMNCAVKYLHLQKAGMKEYLGIGLKEKDVLRLGEVESWFWYEDRLKFGHEDNSQGSSSERR